jgi:hypothetical protein
MVVSVATHHIRDEGWGNTDGRGPQGASERGKSSPNDRARSVVGQRSTASLPLWDSSEVEGSLQFLHSPFFCQEGQRGTQGCRSQSRG